MNKLFKKVKGLQKKLGTLIKEPENLDAVFSGVYHYKNYHSEVEQLAKERTEICLGCDLIDHDDFDPVKDTRIPQISGKMCGECFCSLPYLLRQTKKRCELKKW